MASPRDHIDSIVFLANDIRRALEELDESTGRGGLYYEAPEFLPALMDIDNTLSIVLYDLEKRLEKVRQEDDNRVDLGSAATGGTS